MSQPATRKLPDCKIGSRQIAEWLRSNPVLDPFKVETPVILLCYPDGMFRWPIVPEPAGQQIPNKD